MKTIKQILTIVAMLGSFYLQAQDIDLDVEFTARMNVIFEHVDRNTVASGLLKDYGLEFIDMASYNGIPADSNYVTMDAWKMLYAGIYTCKFGTNSTLTAPTTVFADIDNAADNAVAFMHFNYQALNENALALGYVTIKKDQIHLVPKKPLPYFNQTLFAVAPKVLYFDGPTVSFVFKPELFAGNTGKTVLAFDVDFGDGAGYTTAAWNTPLSRSYNDAGEKTITFRVRYTDGTNYSSRTNIMVAKGAAMQLLPSNDIISIPIDSTTEHSGGTIQIRYSSFNTTTPRQIKKPLIVAEGFDVSCIMGSKYNMDINSFVNPQTSSEQVGNINLYYSGGNLLDKIDLLQYDIIYLDYNKGVDDIWSNAKLFRQVIDSVNTWKQGTQQNVVMGISMGGLVARIALREMELAGVDHQTWKYISMDTPHKGANVPLGFQAAIRHMNKTIFLKNISSVKSAAELLNSLAARQMLIYNITPSYVIYNSMHNTFQQAYDQLGFPQNCQNVCIANGSNSGNSIFAPGSAIIDWLYNSDVKFKVDVNALKNKIASRIYKGRLYVHVQIWFISFDITLIEKSIYSEDYMLPLDGAPGGLYTLDMMGGELPIPSNALKQSQFCFVPTVSALALYDWETHLTHNLNWVSTPFNGTFTQSAHELHTRFNSSASFLYSHLIPSIVGQPTICPTEIYTLSNNAPATWSVTPAGAFTVTPSSGTSVTVTTTAINTSGTLTAVVSGATITKAIHACYIFITGPDVIGCQTRQFISHLPVGASSITWSVGPGLALISGQGSSTAYIQGVSATSATTVSVAFTYNATTHSFSKPIAVQPLNVAGFSLTVVDSWWAGSTKCCVIHVRDGQGNELPNDEELRFLQWYTDNGAIYTYGGDILYPPVSLKLYDFLDNSESIVEIGPPIEPPIFPADDPRYVVLKFTPSSFYGSNEANVTCSYQSCSGTITSNTLTVSENVYYASSCNVPPYIVYPNPASSTLHFELDAGAAQQNGLQGQQQQNNCRVQMYSIMSGALVLDQLVSNFGDNFDIDVSNVPDGLYTLILLQGSEIIQQQTILIQH